MKKQSEIQLDKIELTPDVVDDIIIIGGGPAGLSAYILALKAGLRVRLVEEAVICSNILHISHIEDCPILDYRTDGQSLTDIFQNKMQVLKAPDIIYDKAVSIQLTPCGHKKVQTERHTYFTKTVIIATGCRNKQSGLKGIDNVMDFMGRGVSYCAPCDIHDIRHRYIAVVGHHEQAVKIALYLAEQAAHVALITDHEDISVSPDLAQTIHTTDNVTLFRACRITGLEGETSLQRIALKSLQGKNTTYQSITNLFIYTDIEANTEFLTGTDKKPLVDLTPDRFIKTFINLETSIPGVYAIGAVRDIMPKRILIAVNDAYTVINEIIKDLYLLK